MVTWLKIPFTTPNSCTHQGLSPDITVSGRYNLVRRYLQPKVRLIRLNIGVTARIPTWLFRLHNPEPWPVRVSSSLVRPQVVQQIILARYGKLKSLPQTCRNFPPEGKNMGNFRTGHFVYRSSSSLKKYLFVCVTEKLLYRLEISIRLHRSVSGFSTTSIQKMLSQW